jgi:hypothetical protein
MSDAEAKDPRPLLAIAAVVAGYIVVTHVGRWLATVAALARSPLVSVLTGSVAVGLVALLLARGVVTRRVLAGRVRFVLVPADGFDPGEEAVVRFAAGLVRSRRLLSGLLDSRACAVRVLLDADCDRRLRYVVEVPAHAARALRNGVGSFEGVELREAVEEPEPAGVKWVMSQVGHADSKMTMDVYAQLEQRVDRSHGTNFDRLVRQARRQINARAVAV